MLSNLYIAAVDPAFIIWVIVGIFWFIAQILNRSKEANKLKTSGKKPPARPQQRPSRQPQPSQRAPHQVEDQPPRQRSSMEEELRDFMSSLTGVEPTPRQAPTPPPVPEPKIIIDPAPLPPAPPPVAAPEVHIHDNYELRAEHPGSNRYQALTEEEAYRSAAAITDIEDIEEHLESGELTAQQSISRPQTFLVNLTRLKIPIMRTQMLSQQTVLTKTDRPKLVSRKAMRQAVVSRIILSPPKALGEDIFQTKPGEM